MFLPPRKNDKHAIDMTNAPNGYYPVTKQSVINDSDNRNICRQCDWVIACSGFKGACMSYNRPDGVSVVFKKIA